MTPYIDSFVRDICNHHNRMLAYRYDALQALPLSPDAFLPRLEYLQRVHPSARDITMGIGLCRLVSGEPRASVAFEFLVVVTRSPLARFFLLITRMYFGADDVAAAELHAILGETAIVFPEVAFTLFSTIADANHGLGWCGMTADGGLVVGLPDRTTSRLVLRHDGREQPVDLILRAQCPGYQIWDVTSFDLPRGLPRIDVLQDGRDLLGSSIDSSTIWNFEGFVEGSAEGLSGWCRYPNNLQAVDRIRIQTVDENRLLFGGAIEQAGNSLSGKPPDERYTALLQVEKPRTEFVIPWQELQGARTAAVTVTDHFGRAFYGSPIDPLAGQRYARTQAEWIATQFPSGHPTRVKPSFNQPFPTLYTPRFARQEIETTTHSNRRVAVIITVYRGYEITRTCITRVLQHRDLHDRVVIVNDCSPDPRITAFLDTLVELEGVTVMTNTQNKGFTFSANRGLHTIALDEDAILLNSDTLPPPRWIDALRRTVYRAPDIGTATPLSNAATIFSYPRADNINPIPSYERVVEIAELLATHHDNALIDVPTAHGYCMYIRAECLHQTGLFREDVFAQGYGEENDFCRRAAALGWRHVACLGTYVGHAEGQSFSAVRSDLIRRNLAILNGLHPGYDGMIQTWLARDPLGSLRRDLDLARLRDTIHGRPVTALITHDREGGIQHFVRERACNDLETGRISLIISPGHTDGTGEAFWRIKPFLPEDYPNITMPRHGMELRTLLVALGCDRIEIHSYVGAGVRDVHWISRFGIDYVVYLHDYSWLCPRITLVSYNDLYCGEPTPDICQRCVTDLGSQNDDDIAPSLLRELSDDLFRRANAVIAPSRDVAHRYRRHTSASVTLASWEPPTPLRAAIFPPKAPQDIRRILLIGAIGKEKGFNILLALARHIADNALPLRFVIIGFTCDDQRLLATGVVEITGRYSNEELPTLIQAHPCDWGFFPAIWPETWSFVLTEFWRQELPVITFDIGTPAERVRATGNGRVVPLHLSVASLAMVLMNPWQITPH